MADVLVAMVLATLDVGVAVMEDAEVDVLLAPVAPDVMEVVRVLATELALEVVLEGAKVDVKDVEALVLPVVHHVLELVMDVIMVVHQLRLLISSIPLAQILF